MRAVAAGDVSCVARLFGTVAVLQYRAHAVAGVRERHELGGPLDADAGLRETIDEQALVLVLRERGHIRKGAQAAPHVAEGNPTDLLACDPEIRGDEFQAA